MRLFLILIYIVFSQGAQMSPPQFQNSIGDILNPVEGSDEGEATPTPSSPTVTPPRYHNVTIEGLGKARGIILESNKGRDIYSYMSLPYAEPPEGTRRFKYPEEWTREWENETDSDFYDATWLRARCPQNSLVVNGLAAGREDCLHLSVYTPVAPEDKNGDGLAVMVWIHGGAYMSGDATLYVPTKLMDRNVMVVTVQYRLGLLGFLAGEIAEAPGNMGLMDQIVALRWIQKHISEFGGNPDSVTVFGQSAGGASSSWMHLTPLTHAENEQNNGRQLLHRSIPQSGSAFEEWTIDNDPTSAFERTAKHLNCWEDGYTHEEAVDCMVDKPFQDIVTAANELYLQDRMAGGLGFRGLCPVIQKDMEDAGIELVIPKDPRITVADREFLRIPIMSGSVRDEGSLVLGLSYTDYMVPLNITIDDEDFLKYECIPMILGAFGVSDKTGSMSSAMRLAFLPNAEMGDWYSMEGGLVDMGGVMFLKSGLWELVNKVYLADPDSPPLYFYSWEFEADDSLFGWIFSSEPDIPITGGISHADELLYLFHLPADLDQRQLKMVDRMTLIWSNFAIYGNPTPEETKSEWSDGIEKWEAFTGENQSFMLIQDDFIMDADFTTRWQYHSTNGANSTEMPYTTPDMGDYVDKSEFEAVEQERNDFKIATGVLGAVTGGLMIVAVGLAFKMAKRQNDIV